ncbi:STAS domain-containing protein [bacterium]|nr:STAS domain-containing protein [bacterium]
MPIVNYEERENFVILRINEPKIFQEKVFIFREQILNIMKNNIDKFILDLSEVEVINSSGLGVLLLMHDRLDKKNGKMVICGLNPLLKELFKRMRLNDIFQIENSVKDAEELLN